MATTRTYAQPWFEHAQAQEHLRSATALARFALSCHELTEHDGPIQKWWSSLRHDHVHTRASLVADMRKPGADVEAILASACACIVTVAEHERLTRFDKTHAGWDRYLAASIDVVDMATGMPLIMNGAFISNDAT